MTMYQKNGQAGPFYQPARNDDHGAFGAQHAFQARSAARARPRAEVHSEKWPHLEDIYMATVADLERSRRPSTALIVVSVGAAAAILTVATVSFLRMQDAAPPLPVRRIEQPRQAPAPVAQPSSAQRLLVPAMITIAAGTNARLGIALERPSAGPDMTITLTGLPDGVTLVPGSRLETGAWVLSSGDLNEVRLYAGPRAGGEVTMLATLLTSSGVVRDAKSIRLSILERPEKAPDELSRASDAPRTTQAVTQGTGKPAQPARPVSPEQARRDVLRAQELARSGAIAEARLLLEHSIQSGEPMAYRALAETYDPIHLMELRVYGIKPDVAQAKRLYGKAVEAGDELSRRRLEALGAP